MITSSVLYYEVLCFLGVLFCGVTIVSTCEDRTYPLLIVELKSTRTFLILEITFFKILLLVVHEFSLAILLHITYIFEIMISGKV